MPQKGTLVLWRPDIKVLDCTLRDGGLVNNFCFTDEFVKALYEANVKAGVDYMEFGYKASKKIFKVEEFGKLMYMYCSDGSVKNKTPGEMCTVGFREEQDHYQEQG